MEFASVLVALAVCVASAIGALLLHRQARRHERRARQLEEALDEARERAAGSDRLASSLASSLDAVALGVVIEDASGRTVFRNGAAASMVGSTLGETLTAHALSRLLVTARLGEPSSEVLELYGPPRRTLSISAMPLGHGGMTAAFIEDLSERRRLEAVRRDFVANVSHELKTPVAALGLLAETMAGESDPEVLRQLSERLQAEAFRVGGIIEDLISLSRLEAEEVPQHGRVQLRDVIVEAVEQVQHAADLEDVKIDVDEPLEAWSVWGDRRQLVSALFHLLENAVQYSEAGSRVEVGARLEESCLELTVRDYGIGIPSRDLDRIFERFYRVDRGRSRHTGGTGLGLAIVRHVAGNHRGQVEVESHEGEGSAFTLRLPIEQP